MRKPRLSHKAQTLTSLGAWVLLAFTAVVVMFLAAWYGSLLFWPSLLLVWLSMLVLLRGWFIPLIPTETDDG